LLTKNPIFNYDGFIKYIIGGGIMAKCGTSKKDTKKATTKTTAKKDKKSK